MREHNFDNTFGSRARGPQRSHGFGPTPGFGGPRAGRGFGPMPGNPMGGRGVGGPGGAPRPPFTGWGRPFGLPGMPMPPRTPRNGYRLGLLALLREREQKGYGLIQSIREKTNDNWQPKSGAVYPVLNTLLAEGMVSVNEEGVYSLTAEGLEYATKTEADAEALFKRYAEHGENEPELFESGHKLLGALHQLVINGTPEQRAEIATKLDEVRQEIYRKLGE